MFLSSLVHEPLFSMIGRLLLAVILGGLIGWERERRDHPAGLRTHIVVCVGSTLMTLVDQHSNDVHGRIAAQIVTGVGFLGAGTIIRSGENQGVRGLTTAASVWTIAGVGIAVGYGGADAATAVFATLLVLFVLTTVNQFEDILLRRRQRQKLSLVFSSDNDPLLLIQQTLGKLKESGLAIRNLQLETMDGAKVAHVLLRFPQQITREQIEEMLKANKQIIHFDWNE